MELLKFDELNVNTGFSDKQFEKISEWFHELKSLIINNKHQLQMANEKLDQINANLDLANQTLGEVKSIVTNIDGDVTGLDADIQALKDQLANGGSAVTEADLDALLVKSKSVVDGIADLKAAAGAVDDKTPPVTTEPPAEPAG